MRIHIDDQTITHTADDIAAALASATRQVREAGRMITEIRADGRVLSADQIAKVQQLSPRPVDIHFTTINTAELLLDIAANAAATLDETSHLQTDAAKNLQRGETADAMAALGQALTNWQHLEEAARLAAEALHAGPNPPSALATDWPTAIDQLRAALTTLHDAMRFADHSLVADTLLHDLPSVVDHWHTLFGTLAAIARAARTQNSGANRSATTSTARP